MSDTAIRVENLGKRYRIGGPQAQYQTIRETMMDLAAAPVRRLRRLGQPMPEEEIIWALKDVSFEVKHGEVLGIIGRNGAGKTTLLKILSRITEPTEGHAEINGRVGSLLEVGTGFHPELTGRENIYLNGAILGMKQAEIDRRFDEIVAFSEIEKFLDTPVKRYSSGMYVRLAFSVAAHLEPEILLVDEVLAVGDAAFQKKCLGKMGDVAHEGRTVLFVSHNMSAIEQLCQGAVLFESGRVRLRGDVASVIDKYASVSGLADRAKVSLENHPGRPPGFETVVREIEFYANGRPSTTVGMGECLEIALKVDSTHPLRNIGMAVEDTLGRRLFIASPSYHSPELLDTPISKARLVCRIPDLRLLPGLYHIEVNVSGATSMLDRVEKAASFSVVARDVFGTGRSPGKGKGVFYSHATWRFDCVE
jgi:lipopolysaccharide transport system ATP-binding protein